MDLKGAGIVAFVLVYLISCYSCADSKTDELKDECEYINDSVEVDPKLPEKCKKKSEEDLDDQYDFMFDSKDDEDFNMLYDDSEIETLPPITYKETSTKPNYKEKVITSKFPKRFFHKKSTTPSNYDVTEIQETNLQNKQSFAYTTVDTNSSELITTLSQKSEISEGPQSSIKISQTTNTYNNSDSTNLISELSTQKTSVIQESTASSSDELSENQQTTLHNEQYYQYETKEITSPKPQEKSEVTIQQPGTSKAPDFPSTHSTMFYEKDDSTERINKQSTLETSTTNYSTEIIQSDDLVTQPEQISTNPITTSTNITQQPYETTVNTTPESNGTVALTPEDIQSLYEDETKQQQTTEATTMYNSTNLYSMKIPFTTDEPKITLSPSRVLALELEDGHFEPSEVIWNCSMGSRWFQIGELGQRDAVPLITNNTISSILTISVEEIKGSSNRFYCIEPNGVSKLFHLIKVPFLLIDVSKTPKFRLFNPQYAAIFCKRGQISIDDKLHSFIQPTCYSRLSIKGSLNTNLTNSTSYKCLHSNKSSVQLLPSQAIEQHDCSYHTMGCTQALVSLYDARLYSSHSTLFKCRYSEVLLNQKMKLNNKTWLKTPLSVVYVYSYQIDSCIPIETQSWLPEITFKTLKECNRGCRNVKRDLLKCFAAPNTGVSNTNSNNKGKYHVMYDPSSDICKWVFVIEDKHGTANRFSRLSECWRTCRRSNIQYIDKAKLCGKTRFGWVFNRADNSCTFKSKNNHSETKDNEIIFNFEFKSQQECLTTCHRTNVQEICISKLDENLVNKYRNENHDKVLLYHHVRATGSNSKCVPLMYDYSKLGQTFNLFLSKRSCELICGNNNDSVKSEFLLNSSESTMNNKSMAIATTLLKSLISTATPMSPIVRSYLQANLAKATKLDIEPCFQQLPTFTTNHSVVQKVYYEASTRKCIFIKVPALVFANNLYSRRRTCKKQCLLIHRKMKPNCYNDPNKLPGCWPDSNNKTLNKIVYFLVQPENGVNYALLCQPLLIKATQKCLDKFFVSRETCQKSCSIRTPSDLTVENRCLGQPLSQNYPENCTKTEMLSRWTYLRRQKVCVKFSICRSTYTYSLDYPGNTFLSESSCRQHCISKDPRDICKLNKDLGVGRLHTDYYFYDFHRAKCVMFIYAGSLGNRNRFSSLANCEKTCFGAFPTNWTRPKPKSTNKQEDIEDNDYDWRLFSGRYTNVARFKSYMASDICLEDIDFGSCYINDWDKVYMQRYHYNPVYKECQGYMYGGCGIESRNTFMHKDICDKVCAKRKYGMGIARLCTMPVSKCSSKSSQSRHTEWRLNLYTNKCEPVESCGSRGALKTQKICQKLCVRPILQLKDLSDICHLPPELSTCSQTHNLHPQNISPSLTRWYFDRTSRKCVSYQSCASAIFKATQYGNNFATEDICNRACKPKIFSDACQLPMDKGPCNENIPIYHYDWRQQRCTLFNYGGCLGNRNRFINEKKCEEVCGKTKCRWFIENEHRCRGRPYQMPITDLYYYNGEVNKCLPITKPTCLHSEIFYSNVTDCEQECKLPSEMSHVAYLRNIDLKTKTNKIRCTLPLLFNTYPLCKGKWFHRYFYNSRTKTCEFFYYNGCGNVDDFGNRFIHVNECREMCMDNESPRNSNQINEKEVNKSIDRQNKDICPSLLENLCENRGNSSKQCVSNADCSGDDGRICCECYGEGYIHQRQCVLGIGCQLSKHGCCQGNNISAIDESHSNCKRKYPEIVWISSIDQNKIVKFRQKLNFTVAFSGEPRPNIRFIRFADGLTVTPKLDLDPLYGYWRASFNFTPKTALHCGTWDIHINESRKSQLQNVNHQFTLDCANEKYFWLHLNDYNRGCKLSILSRLDDKVELYCPIRASTSVQWKGPNNFTITTNTRYLVLHKVQPENTGLWSCSSSTYPTDFCFRLITYPSSIQNATIEPKSVTDLDEITDESYILYSINNKNLGITWHPPDNKLQYKIFGVSRNDGSLLFWFSYESGTLKRLEFSKLIS